MNYPAVAQLMAQHIGLDVASLGASAFPSAVADHMRSIGIADESRYVEILARDSARLQELVERLTVRESWFFRNGELFAHLRAVLPSLLASHSPRPWRALSLPCSTGEEPYSLALTLLEANVPCGGWRIDAMDVNRISLAAAARGVYSDFSFRQTPPEIRARYFQQVGNAWELSATVRPLVAFRPGNLLDSSLPVAYACAYDLILCRNLLIYLTPDGRRRALEHLEAMLAPEGWLALGHAEPHVLVDRACERIGPDGCFLFRRAATSTHVDAAPPPWALAQHPPRPAPVAISRKVAVPTPVATAPPPSLAEPPLLRARDLADANRLDEALAECQRHLACHGPSADAYALLGILHQARGRTDEALDAFRKTLYLDPRHAEALTHAMLLSAQRGDAAHASLLRQRLARLQQGDAS